MTGVFLALGEAWGKGQRITVEGIDIWDLSTMKNELHSYEMAAISGRNEKIQQTKARNWLLQLERDARSNLCANCVSIGDGNDLCDMQTLHSGSIGIPLPDKRDVFSVLCSCLLGNCPIQRSTNS